MSKYFILLFIFNFTLVLLFITFDFHHVIMCSSPDDKLKLLFQLYCLKFDYCVKIICLLKFNRLYLVNKYIFSKKIKYGANILAPIVRFASSDDYPRGAFLLLKRLILVSESYF